MRIFVVLQYTEAAITTTTTQKYEEKKNTQLCLPHVLESAAMW